MSLPESEDLTGRPFGAPRFPGRFRAVRTRRGIKGCLHVSLLEPSFFSPPTYIRTHATRSAACGRGAQVLRRSPATLDH
jgi:hypothetical protein